jgi:tetratricopeptide (TPR) repeat protein
MSQPRSDEMFAALPDPGRARTLDELTGCLRALKNWAGGTSYDAIRDRVNAAWRDAGRPAAELTKRATIADCFKSGRRRLNTDLVLAVVRAMHEDPGYVAQWQQALRVVRGETGAASLVRAQDVLPGDFAGFAGRSAELHVLRQLQATGAGRAAVVAVIEGMAGVGKTQLAVHSGHLLAGEEPFEQVLFVNLRGFHGDPTQPPADPGAVLECFLRILDVPGHRIPHDLDARATLYRRRLEGRRSLVVLDDAASEQQVRPLLPGGAGSITMITSRRRLAGLDTAVHIPVDVFTGDEAQEFLTRAVPEAPVGDDPSAAERIAQRCGRLPLALGVVAGYINGRPGWTLTDHADRLEQRHREHRLDTGVELALTLSYQNLSTDRQRLFRLLALHPGNDIDPYAAATLTDTAVDVTGQQLRHLYEDHLLQQPVPGRFVLHDLVRAYAADRATDEDRPADRRAALTRLADYYLTAAATAMDRLHPADARYRPRIAPTTTPVPALPEPCAARSWLDSERASLVAIAAHTAAHGWPAHTVALSGTLFRYLLGGHLEDALAIHTLASRCAAQIGDLAGEARALTGLSAVHWQTGQYAPAADLLQRALALFQQTGDPSGRARSLHNLSNLEIRQGRYAAAADHLQQALDLHRQVGDLGGEAIELINIGFVEARMGRHRRAADYQEQALALCRQVNHPSGEATALTNLGIAEAWLGRYQAATDHLQQALDLHRHLGDLAGEGCALEGLGTLHLHLHQPDEAAGHLNRALALFREAGYRYGEAMALNGLGEAATAAGRPAEAITHHTAALRITLDTGTRDQQVRAHRGLAPAYLALGATVLADRHDARANANGID